MDNGPGQTTKVLLERCESGRIGLTANELTWVTGSEGSNPSLSARVLFLTQWALVLPWGPEARSGANCWWAGVPGDHLGLLPPGLRTLDGLPWRVQGPSSR